MAIKSLCSLIAKGGKRGDAIVHRCSRSPSTIAHRAQIIKVYRERHSHRSAQSFLRRCDNESVVKVLKEEETRGEDAKSATIGATGCTFVPFEFSEKRKKSIEGALFPE